MTKWRGAAAACAAALFGIAMTAFQPARRLDLGVLDLSFRVVDRLHAAPQADEVVVIGIDEATLREWPEPLALMHKHLETLLSALAAGRARAVALDIVLPDRSFEPIVAGYDVALLEGILTMRAVGPVVLARTIDDTGEERVIHPPFLSVVGAEGSGLAILAVDVDGKVRRFDEALGASGENVPTFVGQLARSLTIPVRPGWIDFTRPLGSSPLSMRTVLEWARIDDRAALLRAFENKVVFVGALLPSTDRHAVPVGLVADYPAASTPGVLIHAQTLHTLASGGPLRDEPIAAIAWAAIACALLWHVSTTWKRALSSSAAGVAVTTVGALGALMGHAVVLVGGALLAMLLCAAARLSIEVGTELLARRRLRQAFAGYVSPSVMAELEAGRLEGMASRRTHLCVMFMDVRGFTTRTEAESPEVVLSTLRLLFEAATHAVHESGGTVKEFMGDGVMAFFGAPIAMKNPEQAGFDAARATLAALVDVNRSLTTSLHAPLTIGIGIASGEAVVGNIGAAARYAYGAVGDCVNLASRLEGLTKTLGCPVLLGAEVASRLAERASLVDLGMQSVAGHVAVRVFGWKPEASASSSAIASSPCAAAATATGPAST